MLNEGMDRAALTRGPEEEIRSATAYRPRLARVDLDGRPVVVKDYRPCGWFLRRLAGPWLVRREVRIYRALEGCPGVPRLMGRIDRHAFAVEYIPGRNAQEYADGALPTEFFQYFQEVVDAIHAHGVVHCDLKNRRNVVVGENYRPYLVDFTTAFGRTGPPPCSAATSSGSSSSTTKKPSSKPSSKWGKCGVRKTPPSPSAAAPPSAPSAASATACAGPSNSSPAGKCGSPVLRATSGRPTLRLFDSSPLRPSCLCALVVISSDHRRRRHHERPQTVPSLRRNRRKSATIFAITSGSAIATMMWFCRSVT